MTASVHADRLESLLRHDRRIMVAGLAIVIALSWGFLFAGAGMEDEPPARWTPTLVALMFAMWWIMMVAMMLPAAAPTILLAAALRRRTRQVSPPFGATGLFIAGYLAAWALFSAVATGAQWALDAAGLLTPAMRSSSGVLAGATLLAAGLWQLTRLKRACLRHCRSPAAILARLRRDGRSGGWRAGLEHGAHCVGCCWFLMALLFVGGVMNLAWIAGLTAYVLAEKLLPHGERLARVAGLALALGGTSLLFAASG